MSSCSGLGIKEKRKKLGKIYKMIVVVSKEKVKMEKDIRSIR